MLLRRIQCGRTIQLRSIRHRCTRPPIGRIQSQGPGPNQGQSRTTRTLARNPFTHNRNLTILRIFQSQALCHTHNRPRCLLQCQIRNRLRTTRIITNQ